MSVSILERYQSVHTLAAKSGGFITSAELNGLGVPKSTVSRWCQSGRLVRLRRGVYRTSGRGFGFDEAVHLAEKLMTEGQAIGGRSALALWNMPGGSKGKVQLVGPKGRRSVSPLVGTTEYRDLRPVDITRVSGVLVTTALRTVIDTSRVCSQDVIGRQLTDGVSRGLFTYGEISQRLAEVRRAGKQGVWKLRNVLATRPDAGRQLNSYERMARKLFADAGFPKPVAQFHVACGERNYFVDFAWPDVGVLVECDSMLAHSTPEQLQSDLRRQNELIGLGWTLLRFTYFDIADRCGYVEAILAQHLAQHN